MLRASAIRLREYFAGTGKSANSKRRRTKLTRLGQVERLEDRTLLAASFELSSLLPANGGDGTAGFVVFGSEPDEGNAGKGFGQQVSAIGDINEDGFGDFLAGFSTVTTGKGKKQTTDGVGYVVFGREDGSFPATMQSSDVNGANGYTIKGDGRLGFRQGVSPAGDVNGDGIPDLVIGTEDAGDLGEGEVHVIFGGDTKLSAFDAADGDTDGQIDLAELNSNFGFRFRGLEVGESVGWAVDISGDVNGDTINDLVIGAPNDTQGHVYVVFGSTGPFPDVLDPSSLDGNVGFAMHGRSVGTQGTVGRQVDTGLDIYHSGTVPGWTGSGVNHSHAVDLDQSSGTNYALQLFGGSTSQDPNALILETAIDANHFGVHYDVSFDAGPSVWEAPWQATAATDGLLFEILRANGSVLASHMHFPGAWPGGASAQALTPGNFSYTGDDSGNVKIRLSTTSIGTDRFGGAIDNLQITASGNTTFSEDFSGYVGGVGSADPVGGTISVGGDLNNDGLSDIVIGRHVVYGKSQIAGANQFPASFDLETLDGTNGFVIKSQDSGDAAGIVVSSDGDLNADGIDDLAISATRADPNGITDAGAVYVVFGRETTDVFPATFELSSLDGANGFVINGSNVEDVTGTGVALSSDMNGDQIDDLLIGVRLSDPGGRIDAGQVYVVYGRSTPFAATFELASIDGYNGFVVNGIDAGDAIGGALRSNAAGDINNDGLADLIIGSHTANDGKGEVYVLFGSGPPQPGITVTPTSGLETTEAGGTAQFTVVLDSQPSDIVTINLSSSDDTEGIATESSLTFTTADWDQAQTVTVMGVDDLIDDDDIAYAIITAAAVSTDPAYNGLDPSDVTVTNVDDDGSTSPNTLYVSDISFDSKRGGKDWRAVFQIRSDSDGDGQASASDNVAAGVTITVEFNGTQYTGTTDSNGIFRTSWHRNLGSGNYYADVVNLTLGGFVWNPLDLDVEDDSDGDGLPDDLLVV